MAKQRQPTATSAFGVGRRENHDATGFYNRFSAPTVSADSAITSPSLVDDIYVGDSRHMDKVDAGSVALVVTSPPYFAGKEYEEALGEGHIPATYLTYLDMLTDVFAECVAKLEPGGRIAVNVANLGRKPYRSLAADVIGILQDRLGLLLRGEVIWWKARGAAGSCAWGSFQSPSNPVLRDLTERVVIASKGRFDRAVSRRDRHGRGLPSEISITKDEFMEATTDLWELPTESATRVGHPAPFPVQLPQRLIELYTYRGDLVLDPFMGAGSTAVAAVRTERHYVGYDTVDAYVTTAKARVAAEAERLASAGGAGPRTSLTVQPPARRGTDPTTSAAPEEPDDRVAAAIAAGQAATEVAGLVLEAAGFTDVEASPKVGAGVDIAFAARDRTGARWFVDVSGAFTTTTAGLRRTDLLWRTLGKAAVLRSLHPDVPLLLLTTDVPAPGTPADASLKAVQPALVTAVIELLSPADRDRLARLAGSS